MSETVKPNFFPINEAAVKRKMFEDKIEKHKEKMDTNPFSQHYKTSQQTKLSRDDPNYGRPPPGSKSEKRAMKAAAQVNTEIAFLCDMISQEGHRFEDGRAAIRFGDLFQLYTVISSKLVGTLLRGRKYGFIGFEGETLFQRRDDDVPVFLMKPLQEIKKQLASDTEFEVGISHNAEQ